MTTINRAKSPKSKSVPTANELAAAAAIDAVAQAAAERAGAQAAAEVHAAAKGDETPKAAKEVLNKAEGPPSLPKPIALTEAEAATLDSMLGALNLAKAQLGESRANYLAAENQFMQRIGQIQQELNERVARFALVHGIDLDARPQDLGHSWHFDAATKTFTPVPLQ